MTSTGSSGWARRCSAAIVLVALTLVGAAAYAALRRAADYCTLWLDRLLWWDWSQCCFVHDGDYAAGVVKPVADGLLEICVNAVLPGMGSIMALGLGTALSWWFWLRAQKARAAKSA